MSSNWVPHVKKLKSKVTKVKMKLLGSKLSLFQYAPCGSVEQGIVAKDVKMHHGKDEFGKVVIALSTEQSITSARTP